MSRPWMPLYVSDYLGDTAHLTTIEHGAYLLLMMHYWQSGGLPDDDERLARITRFLRIEDWLALKPVVQAFFYDGWRHKRIETEFAKSVERSKAGRQGGRPKAKEKQTESKGKAPLPHPQEEVGRGGDAPAREPDLTNVFELTLRIGVIAGYPDATYWPPGWKDAPLRVKLMLGQGWKPEIILAAVAQAMATKVDGPPFSINFFEKPIARAHARAAKPLPIIEETTHEAAQRSLTLVRGLDGGKRSVQDVARGLVAEFGARDTERAAPVRTVTGG